MKKTIVAFVLSLCVGAGLAWSYEGHQHGDSEGKEIALKGELVDLACFMAHDGKGSKHGQCGKMCVQGGSPMGLLTADGTVYLLIEDHSSAKAKKPYTQAKKLVAESVSLKGSLYKRGGTQAVVVGSVEKE